MKIGPFDIRFVRPRLKIEIVHESALSEEELNRAIGAVENSHPLLRAVLQLMATAKENAHELAADELKYNNPLLVAGYTGGAKHVDMLREDLLRRRELGKAAIAAEFQRRGV